MKTLVADWTLEYGSVKEKFNACFHCRWGCGGGDQTCNEACIRCYEKSIDSTTCPECFRNCQGNTICFQACECASKCKSDICRNNCHKCGRPQCTGSQFKPEQNTRCEGICADEAVCYGACLMFEERSKNDITPTFARKNFDCLKKC